MPSKIFNRAKENEIKRLARGGDSLANWTDLNFSGSSIGDIEDRSHTLLQDKGDNTHAAIDTFIGDIKGVDFRRYTLMVC